MGSNCVHAVTISDHNFEGRSPVKDASANAGLRMPGLLQAIKVIDGGSSKGKIEVPTSSFFQRHGVVAAEENKVCGTDFLVVVAGEWEWVFRNQGKQRAEPIDAEPVQIDTCAGHEAEIEAVFKLGHG